MCAPPFGAVLKVSSGLNMSWREACLTVQVLRGAVFGTGQCAACTWRIEGCAGCWCPGARGAGSGSRLVPVGESAVHHSAMCLQERVSPSQELQLLAGRCPEQPRGWGPALRGWTGDVCHGCQAAQVLWCGANGGATVVKLYVCHCLDAGSQAATRNPGKLYTP